MWSEESTPDGDIDLTMTPGGRRDENELFLPNLERQKGEQGEMSPQWLSLCLESYLVIEQAKGWDKGQRPSPGKALLVTQHSRFTLFFYHGENRVFLGHVAHGDECPRSRKNGMDWSVREAGNRVGEERLNHAELEGRFQEGSHRDILWAKLPSLPELPLPKEAGARGKEDFLLSLVLARESLSGLTRVAGFEGNELRIPRSGLRLCPLFEHGTKTMPTALLRRE